MGENCFSVCWFWSFYSWIKQGVSWVRCVLETFHKTVRTIMFWWCWQIISDYPLGDNMWRKLLQWEEKSKFPFLVLTKYFKQSRKGVGSCLKGNFFPSLPKHADFIHYVRYNRVGFWRLPVILLVLHLLLSQFSSFPASLFMVWIIR